MACGMGLQRGWLHGMHINWVPSYFSLNLPYCCKKFSLSSPCGGLMKRDSTPSMMLAKEHPCKADLLANACLAAASSKPHLMLFNNFMTSAFGFLVVNPSNENWLLGDCDVVGGVQDACED